MSNSFLPSTSPTSRPLTKEAIRLHNLGRRWLERNHAGAIPLRQLADLGGKRTHDHLRELLNAGLWIPVPGGYSIAAP